MALGRGTPRSPGPAHKGLQSPAPPPLFPPTPKPKTTCFLSFFFLSPPREVSSHQMLPGSPSKEKRPPHRIHLLNQSEQCRAGEAPAGTRKRLQGPG